MPAIYTHRQFGQKVYRALPAELRMAVAPYKPLYTIGQHGPDILFYHKALTGSEVSRLGFATHKVTGREVFAGAKAAVLAAQEKGEAAGAAALAYAIGYVCHFVLDRACHSYVEKMEQVSGLSHSTIETELERYLLIQDGQAHPTRRRLTDHIEATAANAAVIAPFFGRSQGELEKSLKSMIFYNDLLRCPCPLKRGIIYGGLRLAGKYAAMGGLVMRYKPIAACAKASARLAEKAEQAVSTALSCIESFVGYVAGAGALCGEFDDTFGPREGWEQIAL